MQFGELAGKVRNVLSNNFVRKFSAVFFLDLIAKGTTYLMIPVFLTIMSPYEFGLYTYIYFIVFSFHNVIKFGFDTSLSKLFFEVENRGSLLCTISLSVVCIYLLCLLPSILFGIDVKLLQLFLGDVANFEMIRLAFWLYSFFLVIYIFLNIYYQLAERIKTFQIFNLIKILLTNGVAILLIYYLKDDTASLRLSAEAVGSLIVFIPLLIAFIRKFEANFDTTLLKKSLSIGLPMLGSVVASLFYTLSDKYYLQKVTSFDTLAVYNLAMLLMTPFTLIISSFNLVWLPRFFKETNMEKNIYETKKILKVIAMVFAAIFCFLFVIVSASVKYELVDSQYDLLIYILPIIFFSSLFDNLSNLLTSVIIKFEKTIFLLVLTIIASAATFLFNMNLIPIYGIFAACFILVLISFFRFSVTLYYINNYRPTNDSAVKEVL